MVIALLAINLLILMNMKSDTSEMLTNYRKPTRKPYAPVTSCEHSTYTMHASFLNLRARCR